MIYYVQRQKHHNLKRFQSSQRRKPWQTEQFNRLPYCKDLQPHVKEVKLYVKDSTYLHQQHGKKFIKAASL